MNARTKIQGRQEEYRAETQRIGRQSGRGGVRSSRVEVSKKRRKERSSGVRVE